MDRVKVPVTEMREKAAAVFTGLGVPEEGAFQTADALLDAELGGVESHGLMRLKAYSDKILQGMIVPDPDIRISVNGAAAKVDGGNGLGQMAAMKALDASLSLARQYGVGTAVVSHSNHFGTAAYYSNKLADGGCIGFAASVAGPTMAPFGGMDLLLGTNPFSVSFPGTDQMFSADMATSAAAKGKIRIYAKKGQEIPSGWALDADGNDTTDPKKAIEGILLPMGGHKGYGLAMAVDALCGLLSGASLSCESASMFQAGAEANTGHFFMAIDIAHFLPLEEFKDRAQNWFSRLKKSRLRPGVSSIAIPGEPEAERKRQAGGNILILEETARTVEEYYKKYGNRVKQAEKDMEQEERK